MVQGRFIEQAGDGIVPILGNVDLPRKSWKRGTRSFRGPQGVRTAQMS